LSSWSNLDGDKYWGGRNCSKTRSQVPIFKLKDKVLATETPSKNFRGFSKDIVPRIQGNSGGLYFPFRDCEKTGGFLELIRERIRVPAGE